MAFEDLRVQKPSDSYTYHHAWPLAAGTNTGVPVREFPRDTAQPAATSGDADAVTGGHAGGHGAFGVGWLGRARGGYASTTMLSFCR